jgi:hypothetical protein
MPTPKKNQKTTRAKTTKKPTTKRSSNRLTKADMQALTMLDRLVEEDRRIEQKYNLPFRNPRRIATSLQQCGHCHQDIALLIFGDNASDVAGLEAYARLMEEPIKQTALPAYVIAPPSDKSDPDSAALLLKVYPSQGEPCFTTPTEWEQLIKTLSNEHCDSANVG